MEEFMNLEYLKNLAEISDSDAQYQLGCVYADGKIVTKDYVEAMKYLSLSAMQGHIEAIFNLGEIYHFGLGVYSIDYEKAIKFYLIPATNGMAQACYNIGDCYTQMEDLYQASIWYTVAYRLGGDSNPGFFLMTEVSKTTLTLDNPRAYCKCQAEAEDLLNLIKNKITISAKSLKWITLFV